MSHYLLIGYQAVLTFDLSIETYRKLEAETGQTMPWIKSASFINAKEAIANGEMGCQGVRPALLFDRTFN